MLQRRKDSASERLRIKKRKSSKQLRRPRKRKRLSLSWRDSIGKSKRVSTRMTA